MKKIVIVLIVILTAVIGVLFYNGTKKSTNAEVQAVVDEGPNYGNRGNISQTDKIKFLSQNDEYLLGMIGLPVNYEVTSFTDEDMIKFALNVAVERYSSMLTERTLTGGVTGYQVDPDVVNLITEEFFGNADVQYTNTNEYYNRTYRAFVVSGTQEKTLYYYPVSLDKNEEDGSYVITADAIFINEAMDDVKYDEARYEGKYNQDDVDNTIKFTFNSDGKLVSYQYQ